MAGSRGAGGCAKPTIRDVAQAAGVGIGTVSRVINGHPNVGAALRDRVASAIAALGFTPDTAAQSLRGGQSRTFACVVRDLTVPVLASFVDQMQQELDAKGYSLLVASSYHAFAREQALLASFARRRVDGLVIATSSERDRRLLKLLREAPMPVTLLDRARPESLDSVKVDHAAGTRAAIAHLLALGHRRIAVISGAEMVSPVSERLRGVREAHAALGLSLDPALVRLGSFATAFAEREAALLLELRDPPTAFFVAGTALLPGLLRALQARGLGIPQDVSVVAGAESELAEFHVPAISVVQWDHGVLGAMAARFLLQRIEQPGLPPQRALGPTTYVPRGSCAPPR
ncbi:LacI family DNA-binding transcriptional regulator [Roseomonas sp. PWR1]|uniref:LacI family DNA-binding transcriptional regulator n=1 Tax=Roseomonas nitratireducens TaxID=2820810 RepID=A0ABS4AVU4_9PROT|nr:LacI family DNA-binding transcriptional regulator [Neoroseomonas nitratireducens]MBP0465374.1 LacI family DNA-binding transcriptional regulator [Neoroseomonas nitratireducens]